MDSNYNGTTVNEIKFYSNMSKYDSDITINSCLKPIINPVPATARPMIFCKYKPHGIYQPPEVICDGSKCKYKKI